jgi:hypothetical protein
VFLFCQLCDIAKSGYDPKRRFTQIWLQEKYENHFKNFLFGTP